MLGPVLGGFLGEFGQAPFYAAAALALMNVVYGYFVLGESLRDERAGRLTSGAQTLWERCCKFADILLWSVWLLLILSTWWATWRCPVRGPITTRKIQLVGKADRPVSGIAGIFMIAVQAGLIRWAIPRLGAFRAGVLGMVAMTAAFCGYALSIHDWQLYPWLALASLSGFVTPAFRPS